MTHNICVSTDLSYIHKALSLCHSIEDHCKNNYRIWMLCLDKETKELFSKLNLNNLELIEPENFGDTVMNVKTNRNPAEFSWTCKPFLIRYVLDRISNNGLVHYLDADTFFFSDPNKTYGQYLDKPIIITPHNFPENKRFKEKLVGKFNAGVISMSKTDTSYKCLDRWGQQCLDWCFGYLDNGRLGDQMYLDEWPTLYSDSVLQLIDAGVNIGTWNVDNYKISVLDKNIYLNDKPLVLFHFHHFKVYLDKNGLLQPYPILTGDPIIFGPYIQNLRKSFKEMVPLLSPNTKFHLNPNPGIFRLAKQRAVKFIKNHGI